MKKKGGLIPDLVAWNALITGFIQYRPAREAFQRFQEMLLSRVQPNQATILALLPVCGSAESIDGAFLNGSTKSLEEEIWLNDGRGNNENECKGPGGFVTHLLYQRFILLIVTGKRLGILGLRIASSANPVTVARRITEQSPIGKPSNSNMFRVQGRVICCCCLPKEICSAILADFVLISSTSFCELVPKTVRMVQEMSQFREIKKFHNPEMIMDWEHAETHMNSCQEKKIVERMRPCSTTNCSGQLHLEHNFRESCSTLLEPLQERSRLMKRKRKQQNKLMNKEKGTKSHIAWPRVLGRLYIWGTLWACRQASKGHSLVHMRLCPLLQKVAKLSMTINDCSLFSLMKRQFSFGRKAILMQEEVKNTCSTCQRRIALLFFSTSEIETYLVALQLMLQKHHKDAIYSALFAH
ncbi:hypothetical protein VNO77_44451 [Canavalia gladiata]|uniref:Pentatricopeptide repeat-containing protein n=1 Tax=Canavalia gladiata TaxID=3824 RepID=A0AAN9JZQ6_CANGL